MRVVTIGHAANRVPKNLDRRFRHMSVIVGSASLAKIFQDPGLIVTSLDVSFWLHASQGAESLKLLVRSRAATKEYRLLRLNFVRPEALEVYLHDSTHRTIKLLVCFHAAVVQPAVTRVSALTVRWFGFSEYMPP